MYYEKYKDEQLPMIGRVVSIKESKVELEWYIGCYSGVWRVCKIRGKAWTECVPLSCVVSSIQLTKSNKIPPETVLYLRQQYELII